MYIYVYLHHFQAHMIHVFIYIKEQINASTRKTHQANHGNKLKMDSLQNNFRKQIKKSSSTVC